MKKLAQILLLSACSFVAQVQAKGFPVVESYIVDGVNLGKGAMTYATMLQKLGQPARSESKTNECSGVTTVYFYYPSVTFSGDKKNVDVDEVFFKSASKNVIHFKGFDVDAKTTLSKVKSQGANFVLKEKGDSSYVVSDPKDSDLTMWYFDFKGRQLSRVSYFMDDC